ncbi:MAG: 3-phosphoshikimate 1-carboxyvinyltransferase [Firmicutes bacterium]|nr:3-phosphoshikimate 1-carboxyvinyltransferase [Bacillota bacterium]
MNDKITIYPNYLGGEVKIPPSKSMAHRYIIGAALSDQEVIVKNIEASKDIEATLEVMYNLGVEFYRVAADDGTLTLIVEGHGSDFKLVNKYFSCNESGSTLRFLIPLLLLFNEEVVIDGHGKLGERPLDVYYDIMKEQGIAYSNNEGRLPLTLEGKRKILQPGLFRVRGDISSQFITGLLYALPLLDGDSVIEMTTTLESRPYIDLTIKALADFDIKIEIEDYKVFRIPGNQKYSSGVYEVEGDYSQLAFFAVAGAIGNKEIRCTGLDRHSLQGDKAILDIMKRMGAEIDEIAGGFVFKPSKTKGCEIDIKECPDLVPALCVLASLSEGETRIINGERLKIKESNRLESTPKELIKLGADIVIGEDSLTIKGVEGFSGGEVDSWNDHRVAMSLGVASQRADGPLVLTGSGSVAKSYPRFWSDFVKLGGKISE